MSDLAKPKPEHPGYLRLRAAAQSDPLLLKIVDIHEPHPSVVHGSGQVGWWYCHGEQPNGYEWDWPDWVDCETVAAIAGHFGVNLAPMTIDGSAE